MKINPVRTLFFDAVGTLFKVRGTVGTIYGDVARRYGIEVAPDILDRGFKRAFEAIDRLVYDDHPRAQWDQEEKAWWSRLVYAVFSGIGRVPEPFDEYFDEVYLAFGDHRRWEIYPDVLEHLRILKGLGFTIGMISNFDHRIHPLCEGLGISVWLDSIHLPRDVGAAKPDRRIFEAALSHHRVLAHEAIHIGDHPVEDVDGAHAAGLIPILINRKSPGNGKDGIHSMGDLLEWIRRREYV